VNSYETTTYSAHPDFTRRRSVVLWLCFYSSWLLLWRHFTYQPFPYRNCVWYEYCWLCNVSLNLGALALWTNRPTIAAGLCVAVGLDQLLWYVDLAVYALTGKFPIGVAKYICWPGVTWASRITCTHHLWTIPVLLYASRGMHPLAWPLSMVVMTLSVVSSRFLTPSHVVRVHNGGGGDGHHHHKTGTEGLSVAEEPKYLNVNLSHMLWKDIQIKGLQISADNPSWILYLVRLLSRWAAFNTLIFGLLYSVSLRVYGPAAIC
jgi:hypothetical protein